MRAQLRDSQPPQQYRGRSLGRQTKRFRGGHPAASAVYTGYPLALCARVWPALAKRTSSTREPNPKKKLITPPTHPAKRDARNSRLVHQLGYCRRRKRQRVDVQGDRRPIRVDELCCAPGSSRHAAPRFLMVGGEVCPPPLTAPSYPLKQREPRESIRNITSAICKKKSRAEQIETEGQPRMVPTKTLREFSLALRVIHPH
jgi:hypothetical protein